MASWGMGVAQGLKLYDDEVRRREELDRYLSERELFDAQLSEQLKSQESMTAEKDIARANSKIINEYQNALAAGDKAAAAEALNRIYGGTGIRFSSTVEGLQKVDGSGNVENIKLSSEEVLPYVASAGQSRTDMYSDYKGSQKANLERAQEWGLTMYSEESANARLAKQEQGANARARISAEASRSKGNSPFIEDYKGDTLRKMSKESASSILFGQPLQLDKDTGEYFIVGSDDTGTSVRTPVSKDLLAQLDDMTDRIFADAFNTAVSYNFNLPISSAVQYSTDIQKNRRNYSAAHNNVVGGEVTQGIGGETNTVKPVGLSFIETSNINIPVNGIPQAGNPRGIPRASGTVGGAVDRIFRSVLNDLPVDPFKGLLY